MRNEERRELDDPVAQGLLQNIGDGILLTDREEEIQFMNPAAEKILGVTGKAESARFSAVCPLVNVETGEAYPSPIPRVIRTGRAAGLARNIGIFRGGEKVYLSATCSPVGDMDGGVSGCSIILRDISKLRQLEMRAEKDRADAEDARQRAVEASRVKDRFLVNMGHELRTPLNGINGMLTLLFQTELTECQREYLQEVQTSAGELLHRINAILKFSKPENGGMELDRHGIFINPKLRGDPILETWNAQIPVQEDDVQDLMAYCEKKLSGNDRTKREERK